MAAPIPPVLIDVGELLGCCVELAEQAGVVIRAVNAKRVKSGHAALGGVLKEGGNVRSWATTADDEAQHLIVGELRRRFRGIKVIGEEEEAEMLPILRGLLWKKGGRRGRWKVRVFKLFPHKLEYFTPAGVKRGELLLAGHDVVIATSGVMASEGVRGAAKKKASNTGPEGEHRFQLSAGPNALVVGAKDDAVLSEWIRALHQLPEHGHVASFRLASGILIPGAGDVSDVGAGEKGAAAAPPAAANGNSLPAIPDALRAVPLEQVCIFVDPLDGTREFVEGRVHNSETLIGISVNNVAVAGAVGLPFWRRRDGRLEEWLDAGVAGTADTDGPVVVISGVVGGGLGGIPPKDLAAAEARARLGKDAVADAGAALPALEFASSEDTADRACIEARLLAGGRIVPVGGAGNKVLQVLLGRADAALGNLKTCLWDTCAPEALLVASGGRMTDYFGEPLNHHADANLLNGMGMLATRSGMDHGAVVRRFMTSPDVSALRQTIKTTTKRPSLGKRMMSSIFGQGQ